MPETSKNSRILHIAERSEWECNGERVGDGTLGRDACGDVYTGLARLMGDTDRSIRAVIISADEVGTEGDEFVRLVRRHRPDVEVMVRTRPERRTDGQSAVAAGAMVFSEFRLRQLAERLQEEVVRRPSFAAPPVEARRRVPETPEQEAERDTFSDPAKIFRLREDSAPHGTSRLDPLTEEFEAEESVEAEAPSSAAEPTSAESTSPARVPWVRYNDSPVRRKPPGGQTPDGSERSEAPETGGQPANKTEAQSSDAITDAAPQQVGPAVVHEDPFGPLLTAEELNALMSDDDDFADEERDALLNNESPEPRH